MDQTPERHDSAETVERRLLSAEEILGLEQYRDYKVVGNFAGDAMDDGAIMLERDRLILTHMKHGNSVLTSFCTNADNELRYVVFVKEHKVDIENVIAGTAIGMKPPRRW